MVANPYLSTTALAASATFNSPWDTTDLSIGGEQNWIVAFGASDQAGTLHVQQSNDTLTIDKDDSLATAADSGLGQSALLKVQLVMGFVRVQYVNGGTKQASFTLNRRFASE